jgi:hypothetical protein
MPFLQRVRFPIDGLVSATSQVDKVSPEKPESSPSTVRNGRLADSINKEGWPTRSQAKKVTPFLSMDKILQIGNYPAPMCGRAIQTKLVTEELRRRGPDGGLTLREWPLTVESRIVHGG